MKKLAEVCNLVDLTRREIQECEALGLSIKPKTRNKYGHLLYDDNTIKRLMQIHFYCEMDYKKKQIKEVFDAPDFDIKTSLEMQIKALEQKKIKLEKVIDKAKLMYEAEINQIEIISDIENVNFDLTLLFTDAFVKSFEETKNEEFSKKLVNVYEMTDTDVELWLNIMEHLSTLYKLDFSYSSKEVQEQIEELHSLFRNQLGDSIIMFSYVCSMYSHGKEFARIVDEGYGDGTSEYIYKSLEHYCKVNKNNSADEELIDAIKEIEKLGRNLYKTTSDEVQAEVIKIHHFYSKVQILTPEGQLYILRSLGNWIGSSEVRSIVDEGAEHGIAWFFSRAIEIYCDRNEKRCK